MVPTMPNDSRPNDRQGAIPAPFVCNGLSVRPEWIDGNGHMNVAYYLKAFDEGFDAAYDAIQFGFEMIERRGVSTMAPNMHIPYQAHPFQNDPIRIETHLI